MSVAVFEKSREVYPQPRAVGFDHDAMRLFQHIGAAADLAPHIASFRDSEYFGADGRLIQRVRRIAPPFPLTWEPNYTCDQPGIEAVLRAAVGKMSQVEVHLGRELLQATDEDGRVRLQTRDEKGGLHSDSADYVVACDGASSPVRRALGIGLESMDYDEPWIVVDVRVNPEHLARLPSTNVQYCEPERPCTFITCPGNHRRWEFMTLPGEPDAGIVSEERLWRLLARWLKPGEARIWRAAAYRFHALIAEQWRHGRILLAGDSAHQTPPFLGQGMCQGLRDAGNLAWKLEQVLRGAAPEALLDSYMAERRPHVAETTRMAKAFGCIVSERDPKKARERDLQLLGGEPGEPRTLYRQELIPGLQGGLTSSAAPLAGKVFPQPQVRTESGSELLLDDIAAAGWRLVLCGAILDDSAREIAALARPHALRLVQLGAGGGSVIAGALQASETDGLLAHWLESAACIGALVRPDHYVYGGFDSTGSAQALLDEWSASPYQHAAPSRGSTRTRHGPEQIASQ